MAVAKEAQIASAAADLADGIREQVHEAEQLLQGFEGGLEAFLVSGHPIISDSPAWALAPLYADCYTRSGAKTRNELEQIWKDHARSKAVQESAGEVLDAEQEFQSFIDKLAAVLDKVEDRDACPNVSVVGSQLPNLCLINARSGSSMALDSYWKRSPFTHFALIRHFG